jgi:hypothetical protein
VPIAMPAFYESFLWITQSFSFQNPDLHHGLLAQKYAQQQKRKPVASLYHWATANSQYPYSRTIYKRCHFNVDSSASCGYSNEEVAELKQGDRVELLSGKIRSASGTEIYEVRFHSWTGWMDAADLTLEEAQ